MTELSKEQSKLEDIKNRAQELYRYSRSYQKSNKMLLEDSELGELATEELKELEPKTNRVRTRRFKHPLGFQLIQMMIKNILFRKSRAGHQVEHEAALFCG